MIRGTKNEGISTAAKAKRTALAFTGTGVRGEGIETVLAGATEGAAVLTEVKEIDDLAAYQSTTPSGDFNGTYE